MWIRALYLLLSTGLSFFASFFIPVINTDEGGWATMAKYTFKHSLYTAVIDHKPPFLFQFHWLLSGGESSLILLHIMTALWMFLGALAFYYVLNFFLDERKAFFGALLFSLLSGVVNYGTFCPERFYLPFILFAALMAVRILKTDSLKSQIMNALLLGAFVGAAGCIKQPAFLMSLVPFWILLKKGIPRAAILSSVAVVSLLVFTWISWLLVEVPFSTIWSEAYQANFRYIHSRKELPAEHWKAVFDNILIVLGVGYLSIVLGSLLFITRLKQFIFPVRDRLFNMASILLLLFTSIWMVSMGGRYYQNYMIILLPLLCLLTTMAVDWNSKLRKALTALAFLTAVGYVSFTLTQQLRDKNKNWDSQVKQVIESVKKDTSPTDSIWLHHAIPSIYYMTDRAPATRFLYFMHTIDYVDVCVAPESDLKEDLNNDRYQTLLQDLRAAKPKVIFWVHRHINTCADRLKLENFPTIEVMIKTDYTKAWSNALGTYYLRKS
ncbi:MAG: hypothetical protein JWQ35_2595 [Bacteriovoracaceae bacterium]|nr:hypothetical protein [Bacteriovoracaceae bacterium]